MLVKRISNQNNIENTEHPNGRQTFMYPNNIFLEKREDDNT